MQVQKDSGVLIHTADLQQLAVMEKVSSCKPQGISERGKTKRESFISALLILTRRIGLSKGKNARSMPTWEKHETCFPDFCFQTSSSSFIIPKKKFFFCKLVNIYGLLPWLGKPALLWKVRSVYKNYKQNEVYSKSLTANLIINVNFSSMMVGKNIFKTYSFQMLIKKCAPKQ